jgi:deoxyribodipyrimidine photolyase-related protein
MTNFLLILFPNQLFDIKYIEEIIKYNPESDTDSVKKDVKNKCIILLWEHPYFFTKYPFHKLKLVLHRATMCNYYDKLSSKYNVEYIESIDTNHDKIINAIINKNKIKLIKIFNPIERELNKLIDKKKLIKSDKVEYLKCPTPYFLNSEEVNSEIDVNRHDIFYKLQRIRYNILVKKVNKSSNASEDKFVPLGNSKKWSYDTENRSKFPNNQENPDLYNFKSKTRDEYITEAIEYVDENFSENYGKSSHSGLQHSASGKSSPKENFIYPINHMEAAKWLDHFIKEKLDNFGKYEDAMSSNIKFGYHSLLSALNNIGLITTSQILKKIQNNLSDNIASKEGFIRQIIGWREYCYYVYNKNYDSLISTSIYHKFNKKDIPDKIWKAETLIPIIDDIIKKVNEYAYSHHIERLMGIGNFLLLIGVKPESIYFWFQTMYIDSYDVFMIPNVYGMLLYAMSDKSRMMTKPYFCSSNYLMKMSNYKSSTITFSNITCKWDEVFDALYYNLINNHADIYKQNYSSASSVSRWMKFTPTKKKNLLDLSKKYINWIHS